MEKSKEIQELIRDIAGGGKGMAYFVAQVKSVEAETCTVQIGNVTVSGVRLNASADGNERNILVKPKPDSIVVVLDLSGGNLRSTVVVSWSDIDTITIHGGENAGIVKVIELTEKLNAIEKDINSLKDVFKNWSPVTYDGGASLKAGSATWFAQKITETKQEDIENNLIKH